MTIIEFRRGQAERRLFMASKQTKSNEEPRAGARQIYTARLPGHAPPVIAGAWNTAGNIASVGYG